MGYVILGWLVFFGVIKDQTSILARMYIFAMSKIEPLLSVVRRYIPPLMGIDFSALIVFFGLHVLKMFIVRIVMLLE
jgi:YggT family protein